MIGYKALPKMVSESSFRTDVGNWLYVRIVLSTRLQFLTRETRLVHRLPYLRHPPSPDREPWLCDHRSLHTFTKACIALMMLSSDRLVVFSPAYTQLDLPDPSLVPQRSSALSLDELNVPCPMPKSPQSHQVRQHWLAVTMGSRAKDYTSIR